jgi:predicted enzyme related to lactoylglutathione lyase
MARGIQTILYPVQDLARAKALFSRLGGPPTSDSAYYVGFRMDGQEIGLVPNGKQSGLTGPLPYWHVADIRTTLRELQDAGAELVQDVKDVGGGRVIASVRDADGNVIGLLQDA